MTAIPLAPGRARLDKCCLKVVKILSLSALAPRSRMMYSMRSGELDAALSRLKVRGVVAAVLLDIDGTPIEHWYLTANKDIVLIMLNRYNAAVLKADADLRGISPARPGTVELTTAAPVNFAAALE